MKVIKIFNVMIIMIMCIVYAKLASAHHPSHGSSGSTRSSVGLILQDSVAKPASQFYLVLEIAQLDESVGQIYTSLFGGEYAFSKKFSAGGIFPVQRIEHNFRPNSSGLGDISIYGKYLFYDSERLFTYLISEWSFPTGIESKGLGRGSVAQTVSLLLAGKIAEWTTYVTSGIQFGYETNSDPNMLSSAGITTPKFFSKTVNLNLALFNTVFFDSDVFTQGSGKLYLQPQINIFLDKANRWILSLNSKVSIYDYLQRRAGVVLSGANNALLTDVLFSTSVGLNYNFK